MNFQWIKQEPGHRDDDELIEWTNEWKLYALMEGGVSGYGVFKDSEYWAIWEIIADKTSEEAQKINEAQYKEALRFANRQSIGQLALFEV